MKKASPMPPPLELPGRLPLLRISLGLTQKSLWLVPRFLIESQSIGHRESYRRFDLALVQAIQLRQTLRAPLVNAICGGLAAFYGWMMSRMQDPVAWFLAASFLAFWLTLLALNLAGGPTCRVELQTALGPHELPTLHRLRTARHALSAIIRRIEQVQGEREPDFPATLPPTAPADP